MAGTALIVLAGNVTKQDFETAGTWDLAVAVDAGMAHFLSFGFKPDILLGDFDIQGLLRLFDLLIMSSTSL